jgi:hypothetical protein
MEDCGRDRELGQGIGKIGPVLHTVNNQNLQDSRGPSPVPSLRPSLAGGCSHSHFTDEDTESQKGSSKWKEGHPQV